jgi:rRNA-processing protein FCF1
MAEAPVSHSSLLENIVQEYKIFIDTCSLCNNGFEDFSKKFFPVLKKHKKQLIVPYRVAEELIKLTKKPDKDLKLLATESYRKLAYYQKEGLIIIQGEKNDNFADNVFQVQFTKFRMQHKLVLITQDKGLATDILNLNNSNSVNGRDVKVFRINAKGFLGPNLGRDYQCLKENFNGKQVDEKQDLNTDSRDGSESIFKFAVKKKTDLTKG